jgi:antirestriction protein ArdC
VPAVDETPWTRPEASDIILKNSVAVVRIGGDRAFYSPSTDHIQLPPDFAFNGPEEFAATSLHELAHWTGHPSRLNRDLQHRFGSSAYAMEELRHPHSLRTKSASRPTFRITRATSQAGSKRRKTISARSSARQPMRIASMELGFHPDYAAQVEGELAPVPA